jgi:hypothetical protein
MTMDAIAADLSALEPAALLVPERIVRRVIRHERRIRGMGLMVPHGRCHVTRGETVREVVRPFELRLESEDEIPAIVLLVGEPEPEGVEEPKQGELRREISRRLFHARVHARLDELATDGRLDRPAARALIDRIGQTRFDEIRSVLRHEETVLPPESETTFFVEFAAWWLEFSHFDPELLPVWFPALAGQKDVDEILGELLDAPALLASSILPGSDEKAAGLDGPRPPPESEERAAAGDPELSRTAALRASRRGNTVRAAIHYARAGDTDVAAVEMKKLVDRLGTALSLSEEEVVDWTALVTGLLPAALPGVRSRAGRALFDLQKVCVERERLVHAVDVVEWVLTFGRRPIRRPLPCARETLMHRHLVRAAERYERLHPEDRRGAELFALALRTTNARVKAILKPGLLETAEDVGLVPRNAPERVAKEKLVAELLDLAARRGRLRMGDVRDAFSRSQLKLPDVKSPADLWFRQPVLRADRLLSVRLDGVYTRGEFYLRWLQMFSSLLMGTVTGRWLTLWVLLPLGGAYLTLEGVRHLIAAVMSLAGGGHPAPVGLIEIGALATLILGLIHSDYLRHHVWGAVCLIGRGIKALFTVLPRWLIRLPIVVRILESRAFNLVFRFILKPAALTGMLWGLLQLLLPEPVVVWRQLGALFIAVNVLSNSPFGRRAEEIGLDWLIRNWHFIRVRILAGLLRVVLAFFRRVMERLDHVLYRVDEWLRFRSGEKRVRLVTKAVLGTLWFFLSYVVRLYVNLLIEPQVNPIKHFPVVTVSHKVTLPMFPTLQALLAGPLTPAVGKVAADAIAGTTVFLMPGVFGFLVWELKENWRLFATNRSARLRPAVVGEHGESLPRLLRPGFHSGTVPKLFARLRHGTRTARETGDLRPRRRARNGLESVNVSVRRFIDREFLGVLRSSDAFKDADLALRGVDLALNRISVTVTGFPSGIGTLTIDFEEQAAWIVAGVRTSGFAGSLEGAARTDLTNALAGLYALCGVELIRERIEAGLGDPVPAYDLRSETLIYWPDANYEREEVRPLEDKGPAVSIRWMDWVACWEAASRGETPRPELIAGPPLVPFEKGEPVL